MNIELGWASDLAAISAVGISLVTFWFGYVKAKRSEQIKSARELMDKINKLTKELDHLFEVYSKSVEDNVIRDETFDSKTWVSDLKEKSEDLLPEMEYFSHLVDKNDLDDKAVISYYLPKVKVACTSINTKLWEHKKDKRLGHETITDKLLNEYSKVTDKIKALESKKA